MKNVTDKCCRENQSTDFVFSNFSPKILPFVRQCGKIGVETNRPQMTIWHMRITCWIPKATETLSEHVIFLVFPQQQWLDESASVLRHTYIASLVTCFVRQNV